MNRPARSLTKIKILNLALDFFQILHADSVRRKTCLITIDQTSEFTKCACIPWTTLIIDNKFYITELEQMVTQKAISKILDSDHGKYTGATLLLIKLIAERKLARILSQRVDEKWRQKIQFISSGVSVHPSYNLNNIIQLDYNHFNLGYYCLFPCHRYMSIIFGGLRHSRIMWCLSSWQNTFLTQENKIWHIKSSLVIDERCVDALKGQASVRCRAGFTFSYHCSGSTYYTA